MFFLLQTNLISCYPLTGSSPTSALASFYSDPPLINASTTLPAPMGCPLVAAVLTGPLAICA